MKRKGTRNHQFAKRIPADIKDRIVGMTLDVPVGDEKVPIEIGPKTTAIRFSLKTDDPSEVKARQASAIQYLERIFDALRIGGFKRRPADLDPSVQMTGREIEAALRRRHPSIENLFGTGIGLRLMKIESDILVEALLSLADREVVALPMHDGLMVQETLQDEARRALEEACFSVAECQIPVVAKPLK